MGGTSSATNVNNTDIRTNTSNVNTNISSTNIDNSQQISSTSNVQSTNISSQATTNVSNVDNSTKTNISSVSNSTNIDQSTTITSNFSGNITDNIVKCGMDASGAKDLVANLDSSINQQNNASNSFIVTGSNNTISNVTLQSMLTSYGPNVDKSCVQKAVTEARAEQIAANTKKSSLTGSTVATQLESGKNVTVGENATTSANVNKTQGGSTAQGESKQEQKLSTVFENKNLTETSNVAKTEQKATASATGSQVGAGQVSSAGGPDLSTIVPIIGGLIIGGILLFVLSKFMFSSSTVAPAAVVEQTGGCMIKQVMMYGYFIVIFFIIISLLNHSGKILKNYKVDKYFIILSLIGFIFINYLQDNYDLLNMYKTNIEDKLAILKIMTTKMYHNVNKEINL